MATERDDLQRDDLADRPDANRDPITGAPGSHPIGTGVGAAGGGAAGAAIGSVVPGVGTVVGGATGAVVGAVAGGLAGKAVAEAVNPTAEDEYWRNEYRNRPYVEEDYDYDRDYAPAYRYGYMSITQYPGRSYDDIERDLESGWDTSRGESRLEWDRARNATRDAWQRVESNVPREQNRENV